jgi:hypothetical protein
MPGIYTAAIVTTLAALTIGAWVIRSAPRQRRPLLAALALHLPMEPLSYYGIRLPLDSLVRRVVDPDSPLYGFLTTFYAPLTEEPAKLWLLLLPWFGRGFERRDAVQWALAIGIGFGIGEMWLVAAWVARNPELARLPWYLFGGYFNERLMVCFFHAAFTSAALALFRRSPLAGLLAAMGLHFTGNFPIYLARINLGGWGAGTWTLILVLWLQVFFLGMLVLLGCIHAWVRGTTVRQALKALSGRARCPGCGSVYPRPVLAANFGPDLRYEQCPHCRRCHFTRRLREEPEPPAS